jgi:hypothetical protein
MTVETSPLTRDELRQELDRTLRHYATKADLAALETRITQALADQTAAHMSALADQTAAHTSALAEQAAAQTSAMAEQAAAHTAAMAAQTAAHTSAMAAQTRWLAGLVLAAAAAATSVLIAVDLLAG